MTTLQRARRPAARPAQRRGAGARRWIPAVLLAGTTFVAVFLLYFLVYRVRRFTLPLGWDTPWYVWRADFVGHVGLGPLDTASRPGHALLTAALSGTTGLSSLELQVVLPYVLVACFALMLGVAASEGLGEGGAWRWLVGAAVGGVIVGTTRLVGENVANLLNVLLVAAAFLLLVRFVSLGRGFLGSVLLLVAAGLAHWIFLGVFGLVLVAWFLLALPSSFRAWRGGVDPWRTEAGGLAATGATTGGVMALLIYPVLESSLRTFEIHEAHSRYLPKLREDLGAMAAYATGPVAALGAVAVARGADLETAGPRPRTRAAFLRMLVAWAAVALGGLGYAAATTDLPPHRFLTLLVAVPGIVCIAALVWTVCRRLVARSAGLAAAFGVLAVAALAIPTIRSWYGPAGVESGPHGTVVVSYPLARGPEQWFDAVAFEEARAADAYIGTLTAGRDVVILVGPRGASGPISTPLKERTIRAALAPEHQERVHVYPGEPLDLLAGRFTRVGGPQAAAINEENRPYWDDVRAVLATNPVLLAIDALGPREYTRAVQLAGATEISPGLALLRGQAAPPDFRAPAPLHPVPSTRVGVLWALGLVLLLAVAGLGWTLWFLGAGATPLTALALAPTVGAAVLMLASLVTTELGLHVAESPGVATFAIVAVAGFALAAVSFRRAGAPAGA